MKESARILLENGVTPRWSTPLGFPVKMHYENTNKYTIKTLVSGVLRQHRLRIPNGDPNTRKTVNAMCPNFIHSLDGVGGLLGAILNRCLVEDIKEVLAVHDSLSVLATEVRHVHNLVREETVRLFEGNPLEILKFQLTVLLPPGVELPTLPRQGDLCISEVLNSPYYWN